jgi:RimJ/RimL family protein N-acetyltransferase
MAELIARLHPTPAVGIRPPYPLSWRDALPPLVGGRVTLRELAPTDASELVRLLALPEVARYMSAPPDRAERLVAFAEWSRREREAGRYAAFAVTLSGTDRIAGVVQLRVLDPDGHGAEWGIALGPEFWGVGLFGDAGRLLADFAFDVVGVHRLEARVALGNARALAAMQKLGAVREGVLRRSLVTADGLHHDQVLWSLLADDWRAVRFDAVAERVH